MSSSKGRTSLALHRVWHHTDANDRILGKIAARIAWVLMGKHKPTYEPSADHGDFVVVSNALNVRLTGKKSEEKEYIHHSGFIGGLKRVPITRMRERHPGQIIRKAVSGMLPKNTFRERRLERLKIYPGPAPSHVLANTLITWRDMLENSGTKSVRNGEETGRIEQQ